VSGNKYKRYVAVIPEDEADRQLANGFSAHTAVFPPALDIRPVAGGWLHVLDVFEKEYVPYMRRFPAVHVVLLLDFDERGESRRTTCEDRIPSDLKPRTFLVGTSDAPEDLKRELNMSLEQIGKALADDCGRADLGRWTHPHLVHNLAELQRMLPIVHPILFPGA
jgi:hypothetical protein